jgi:hypothetical protein
MMGQTSALLRMPFRIVALYGRIGKRAFFSFLMHPP